MLQSDLVMLALGATETTETNLGTINIPSAGVSKIVGVYGINFGVQTTGESAQGYFRLAFKTVAGTFKFPTQTAEDGAGTLAGGGYTVDPKIIPVDIPVPPNETVTVYAAQHIASTGTRNVLAGVLMQ